MSLLGITNETDLVLLAALSWAYAWHSSDILVERCLELFFAPSSQPIL